MLNIQIKAKASVADHIITIINKTGFKSLKTLTPKENKAILEAIKNKKQWLYFFNGELFHYIVITENPTHWEQKEKLRSVGSELSKQLNHNKVSQAAIFSEEASSALALTEGIALKNYQFLKYKTKSEDVKNTLTSIHIVCKEMTEEALHELNTIIKATYVARDLVNEPQSYLNAIQLSEEFKKLSKEAGFKLEVWNEAKIATQKMGGLLAVNKGSKIPPTFNIMEYKPKNATNKKPFVLVGKGIVYDTGGLSLKPTPQSMDFMKCDMAGSAVVAGVMYAIALLKLPLHVVGLVPATDNWIGENSYAPGDVITMYSGTTVEILNTDAEGRLVLADALHFAKKLKPELVVDFATLTGAAVRAIGPYASAMMGTANDEYKGQMFESSYAVFERLIEFPLWQDYADELKSSVADMTNLGKGEGGQISAAKFLEHFTDYPWMHIDIAGTAFNHADKGYQTIGGTGVGVRMMIDFLSKQCSTTKK